MSIVEQRLQKIGITVPDVVAPRANYIPYVITGNLIFISAQGPDVDGEVKIKATVGRDITADDAMEASQLCAINILAQIKSAIGDLDRVSKVVKITGYVNSTDDFLEQPKVINGASNLFVEAFGQDIGSHARAAIGANTLPSGGTVEMDAVIEFQ